jgi:hypothetical protein
VHRGGTVDTPVNTFCFRREDAATPFGIIADRDDVIEILPFILIYALGALPSDVCLEYCELDTVVYSIAGAKC